jgi:hypothetical protein
LGAFEESCCFYFSADRKEIVALARSPEHLLEICDVVLRLLAVSVAHSVILRKRGSLGGALINAASLAYMMEHCQSLKVLRMQDLIIDENQCRVLGAYSKPYLEIELTDCAITAAGTSALAEVLGRNQGPTKLDRCDIDYSVLADGLRGNSRLKILRARFSSNLEDNTRNAIAIAGALRENKGLVEQKLRSRWKDGTWDAVCDSLKTHPTLQVLDLWVNENPLTPAVLTSRMQVLVDMMKVNTSIHTIHLNPRYSEHELFRELIVPYLETNRLRPRLLAIQKTRPIAYRAKILGRALLSTRTDANSFWMLLSGNPQVAFSSTTATTTPAANLPTTPATADADADATFNAATAAVTVTATCAASTAGASAVANVATPTACQKRKTCP